jgi:hypothetical protein
MLFLQGLLLWPIAEGCMRAKHKQRKRREQGQVGQVVEDRSRDLRTGQGLGITSQPSLPGREDG